MRNTYIALGLVIIAVAARFAEMPTIQLLAACGAFLLIATSFDERLKGEDEPTASS